MIARGTSGYSSRRRRRGAALVELALCIPMMGSMLAITMFLGWAMMNQQEVKAAARYVSWRMADTGWQYQYVDPNTDVNDPVWNDDPNYPGLNQLFFRGDATSVSVSRGGGPVDEIQSLVDAAAGQSDYAGTFADKLLVDPYSGHSVFPRAQRASVATVFGSDVAAFRKYTGAIHGYHIRDGVEWRRNEVGLRYVTRKQFLDDLDQVLQSVPEPGSEMGRMIRQTYLSGW